MKKLLALLTCLILSGCTFVSNLSTVLNHGGPVLTHPVLHIAFWGDYWTTHPAEIQQIKDDWETLLTGHVLDRLYQYGVQAGSFDAVNTPLPGNVVPDNTSADVERAEIVAELDAGLLSAPTQDDVYMVMLPPGFGTAYMRTFHFAGYHTVLAYQGKQVVYAMVGYGYGEIVASHELYEAATDPFISGWHTSGGDEVGDLCDHQPTLIDGITVQKVWSNTLEQCL